MICLLPEQALLDPGSQTPPPSPFSVQAFNRATGANGAQGFDYGLSNNKGNASEERNMGWCSLMFLNLREEHAVCMRIEWSIES